MGQDWFWTSLLVIAMGLGIGIVAYSAQLKSLQARFYIGVALIGGLIFTAISGFILANLRTTEEMPPTTGIILTKYPNAREYGYTEVSVEYTINGQIFTAIDALPNDVALRYELGDEITIYYMPLMPGWAELYLPFNRRTAIFMFSASLSLLLAGGIPTFASRRI